MKLKMLRVSTLTVLHQWHIYKSRGGIMEMFASPLTQEIAYTIILSPPLKAHSHPQA